MDRAVAEINNPRDPAHRGQIAHRALVATNPIVRRTLLVAGVTNQTGRLPGPVGKTPVAASEIIIPTGSRKGQAHSVLRMGRDKIPTATGRAGVVHNKGQIKIPAITAETKNNEILKSTPGFTPGVFYFC